MKKHFRYILKKSSRPLYFVNEVYKIFILFILFIRFLKYFVLFVLYKRPTKHVLLTFLKKKVIPVILF